MIQSTYISLVKFHAFCWCTSSPFSNNIQCPRIIASVQAPAPFHLKVYSVQSCIAKCLFGTDTHGWTEKSHICTSFSTAQHHHVLLNCTVITADPTLPVVIPSGIDIVVETGLSFLYKKAWCPVSVLHVSGVEHVMWYRKLMDVFTYY